MPKTQVLFSGLAIGESPRWHDGKLWLCNWCTQEIATVGADGTKDVVTRVPTTFPFSIERLPRRHLRRRRRRGLVRRRAQ